MGIYGSIASPPPLKASDKQGLVLYMGSMSKTLGPGCASGGSSGLSRSSTGCPTSKCKPTTAPAHYPSMPSPNGSPAGYMRIISIISGQSLGNAEILPYRYWSNISTILHTGISLRADSIFGFVSRTPLHSPFI